MPDQNRELSKAFQSRTGTHEHEGITVVHPLRSAPRTHRRIGTSPRPPAPEHRKIARTLFWMVFLAFAIRITVALCTYQNNLTPVMNYWWMGQEQGHVAESIVKGHGFGNPLYTSTGPTAWFAPVYPYILAADFAVFGVFTKASCIAILFFQALISSLTCLPIFFFARRAFTHGAALAAGWFWVVYPYSAYWPIYRIWDTWLTTLLLAILFCVILRLAHSPKLWHWIGFGVLAGFAGLNDPVVFGVLPILALWAVWRLHKQGNRWFAPAVAAVLAVIFTVSPWIIRDAVVFHKFIPIRDNLPLEFRVGNNGDSSEPLMVTAGPWVPWIDNTEWNEYTHMGELAYFHLKGEQAQAYIAAHPIWYAGMVGRRFIYIWTGFWSFSARYLHEQPLDPLTVPLLALLSVLTFMGLARAYLKKGGTVATPYELMFGFFPLIYYLTHVGGWYRCPMDPFIVTLAAYEVHSRAVEWLRHRRATQVAYQSPAVAPAAEEIPVARVSQS
jgi:hypothetical protein